MVDITIDADGIPFPCTFADERVWGVGMFPSGTDRCPCQEFVVDNPFHIDPDEFCFTCGHYIVYHTQAALPPSAQPSATPTPTVGPALGPIVGPSGNFQSLPDAAKWLLAGGMLLGRLELVTVIVLFSRSFWRD